MTDAHLHEPAVGPELDGGWPVAPPSERDPALAALEAAWRNGARVSEGSDG